MWVVHGFHIGLLSCTLAIAFRGADEKVCEEIVVADADGLGNSRTKHIEDFLVGRIIAVRVIRVDERKFVMSADVPESELAVGKIVVGSAVDFTAWLDSLER